MAPNSKPEKVTTSSYMISTTDGRVYIIGLTSIDRREKPLILAEDAPFKFHTEDNKFYVVDEHGKTIEARGTFVSMRGIVVPQPIIESTAFDECDPYGVTGLPDYCRD